VASSSSGSAASIDFDVDLAIQRQLTLIGSWVFGTPDLQKVPDTAARLTESLEPMFLERELTDAERAWRSSDDGSLGGTASSS